MTTSGICGTDLHMYDNRVTTPQGKVLGHEALGVIEASRRKRETSKAQATELSSLLTLLAEHALTVHAATPMLA